MTNADIGGIEVRECSISHAYRKGGLSKLVSTFLTSFGAAYSFDYILIKYDNAIFKERRQSV